MASELIITFRETLEAALVVGIMLAYLHKTGNSKYYKYVFAGAGLALLLSALSGYAIYSIWGGFEGIGEMLFEGAMMFIAAALVTWMMVWLARHRNLPKEIEHNVEMKLEHGERYGLFAFAFVAVLREGIEMAVFLIAAFFRSQNDVTLGLSLLGVGLALALGVVIFTAMVRIRLQRLFQVTAAILVLFAGGLVMHGVHEFQEAQVLPAESPLWDSSGILSQKSDLGMILRGLFGYTEKPTITELLAYLIYVVGVSYLYLSIEPKKTKMAQATG